MHLDAQRDLEDRGRIGVVDVAALTDALDDGSARRGVMDDFEQAAGDAAEGSPHVFLPDGRGLHNPGVDALGG